MFRGKKYQESAKQIDRSVQYDPAEALDLVVKTASAKFDETVELHIKLGVDSRHADQQVRGAVVLPNGTGKTRRVLVFTKDAKIEDAKAAGLNGGSGAPNKTKVGTLTAAQVEEIAKTKMPDLNCDSLESAISQVKGTCRSMGVTVVD